ncbi:two-component system sensor histidine kinase NtrB [Desulfonatronum thioautotrophicum]|uniref:two-component system sensor histidine kinase NtrB n=1 Tax=Desulfonatronum thioautotrophicum TaxID=617001 RepID=UPI000699A93B|nr:ATP-binding protein [Desulfonatronum thioautotrophicum]
MQQPRRHRDVVRALGAIEGDFRVGLACPLGESQPANDEGIAAILAVIVELTNRFGMEGCLPRMRLTACSGTIPSAHLQGLTERGVSRFSDVPAMLMAHPEINLVIALTDSPELLAELRRSVPVSVTLLDRPATVFLCCLLELAKASGRCEIDLRGSRNLLARIVDELPDDIFFLDAQGQILDVNRQACERHGLNKEALLHRSSSEVPAGPDQVSCDSESLDGPVLATLTHGRESEALQTWVDDQGRVHYYQVTTYPVFNDEGQLERVVEVRRDVTLRTEMEKRLQQAEKLAAIGELSTYIAHEIRNPLFAIGGFANSLLRSRELSENSRDKVRIILEESKRLDRILKSIINFARPTASEVTEVDINQIVSDTIGVLGIGCEERGVVVDMHLEKELPKAQANVELLKQCLINLVKNALEAMSGGGRLMVTTAMERQQVRISIEDTGHGIPLDLQDKIFNPFFTTKQTGSGAGLGLAMTKKIIRDLGGDLILTSRPDKGTRVDVYLQPAAAMEEKARNRPEP